MFSLKPRIIEKDVMLLVGMTTYGKIGGEPWSEENNIGRLWKRFMSYCAKYADSFKFNLSILRECMK